MVFSKLEWRVNKRQAARTLSEAGWPAEQIQDFTSTVNFLEIRDEFIEFIYELYG